MKFALCCSTDSAEWLADYKATNAQLIESDPAFAEWLETGYKPIAGGWQY
jgi:hypothetical protein